jgi:hypothetical protein
MKLGVLLKWGVFNKERQIKVPGSFSKRWPRKFCSETFYNGYKNLIKTPNKDKLKKKKKDLVHHLDFFYRDFSSLKMVLSRCQLYKTFHLCHRRCDRIS